MKIDVAVQSYKKPESLIYSLFSLHLHCRDAIDTIWINDDRSGGRALDYYHTLAQSNALAPWKIRVRENKTRIGWWITFVRGYNPKYLTVFFKLKRMLWNYYKMRTLFVQAEDIRYQWAISQTDKKYLMVIHDDIEFKGDIVSLYLNAISKNDNIAIVGDLGQCWRCDFKELGCTPERLLSGYRPSPKWPSTYLHKNSHKWACRVNEWSALLNVKIARQINEQERIFYGNYDAEGDTSAYWFSKVIKNGFGFDDPIPNEAKRMKYYIHWDGGITGHSAWVDQGKGRTLYNPDKMAAKLAADFGYSIQR